MVTLCRLLDGRRTLDDLVREGSPTITAAEVIFAVNELEKAGVVVRLSTTAQPSPAARHAESMCVSPGLTVHTTDPASTEAMMAALIRAGLPPTPAATDPLPGTALRLLVVTDYLDPETDAMAAAAEASGSTWMPVKLAGQRSYYGPIFGPGLPACWHCVREGLRANRPVEAWLDSWAASSPEIGGGRAPTIGPGGHALAEEIATALRSGPVAAPHDALLEWGGHARAVIRHPVVRSAACPRCGSRPEPGAPTRE